MDLSNHASPRSCAALLGTLVLALAAGCTAPEKPKPAPVRPQQTNAGPETAAVVAAPAVAPEPATANEEDEISKAAAKPRKESPGLGWKRMFNGDDLTGWKSTKFAGEGEVEVRDGLMILNMGNPFTGVNWTNPPPTGSYEIALEAMRFMGTDFFVGLTVPVRDSHCSLIVGGWGGGLVGISSLNEMDASENETTTFMNFENKKWYHIRMRVTPKRLQAWIDGERRVNVDIRDLKVSLRPGDIERSAPLGIACWQSMSLLRGIEWRPLTDEELKNQ